MTILRRFAAQRILVWLLYLNLIGVCIILLFEFDSKFLFQGKSSQRDYDRWKAIRDNWNKLGRPQGMQPDAVVGSDFYQRARAELGKNGDEELAPDNGADIYNVDMVLNFIPRVPKYSDSDIVPYLNESITKEYLKYTKRNYKEKIVILTPICDVAERLKGFGKLLANLSYPHGLISVYFGEDSSSDSTLNMATMVADELVTMHNFRRATAFHFNISGGIHGTWGDVHHRLSQLERRSHIAKARNTLLKVGLASGVFDYVLWIDSDISELPSDIVQQLLSANRDVVVPSCLFKSGKYKRVFDKNSWRETPRSLEDQSHLPKDILLVEGYTFTLRLYLPDLRADGRVVPLDGVGGCALLVNAECHRNGLVFPEEVYKHHIETEGLGKMAQDMGYSVAGMPFVEVFH